jgi:hypothetical protein
LQGPFVNYFWGGNYRKKDSLEMRNLVEFTPGAMGNLLRFVRMASGNEIKGSAKPAAVVLDKALVPYNYDKTTKQLEWNAAGREALRETLRKGLPASKNTYTDSFGYLWNPQPTDKGHPDFTVEYLLDVKPMPPFIYFTGNDNFVLSEAEVDTLYQYILRGGAIWGDSGFAGDRSKFDIAFKREMRRVIPDSDKSFRPLKKENDLFISGADAYFDRESGFDQLPYGMQFYDAPIEVIEAMPGLVSVVLTKNAYGNFLRFETALVNNRFQIGGVDHAALLQLVDAGFQPGERLHRIVHPHRRVPDLAGVEIAGDHHQIGMERVDLIHDAVQPHLRHIPIAAMQIGKMHHPQRPLQPGQFDAITHHRRIADRAEPASPSKGKHQAGNKEREAFQSRALFSLSSARKALNGLSFSATPPAATRRSC